MPRAARKKSKSGIYHVILRGINKQRIFEEEEDYQKFLEVLREYKAVCGYEVFAYCLMTNHVHILIRPGKEDLDQIFRRIGARFVYWYNLKYRRVGHLFQDRYKSETVEDDRYFLTVVRYIHQNPVKAGLCRMPCEYSYSSYSSYFEDGGFIDSELVKSLLGREEFERFCCAPNSDCCLEISDDTKKGVTEEKAEKLMRQISHCNNAAEFQKLPVGKRDAALRKMLDAGVSIRQASRITGISFGIVRKFTQ